MPRNWSATRQAEENVAQKQVVEHNENVIDALRTDIDTIENVLADLNRVQVGSTNEDLLTAVRSLGACQAILKRKLSAYTS